MHALLRCAKSNILCKCILFSLWVLMEPCSFSGTLSPKCVHAYMCVCPMNRLYMLNDRYSYTKVRILLDTSPLIQNHLHISHTTSVPPVNTMYLHKPMFFNQRTAMLRVPRHLKLKYVRTVAVYRRFIVK
jgi:hypothetical protein